MLTVAASPNSNIWLPVLLYNGCELVTAGHIKISPTDNYASFGLTIGRLISFHPNCIQSHLIYTAFPGATSPLQYQWKATITQWTDFSLVSQHKHCCFLVIVYSPRFASYQNPMLAPGYINWVQEWQRSKLAATMQSRTNKNNVKVTANASGVQRQRSPKIIRQSGVCEECNTPGAGADESQFHHCKLDAIVVDPWRFEPEPENKQTGLYSLFGPMPGVDSILHALRQAVADS